MSYSSPALITIVDVLMLKKYGGRTSVHSEGAIKAVFEEYSRRLIVIINIQMISIIVKLLFTNSIVATVDLEKSIDQILACSDILGLDSEGHVPTICYEAAVGLTPNLRRGRRSIHQTPFQVPSMNQMCSSECKRYPRLIRIDVSTTISKCC